MKYLISILLAAGLLAACGSTKNVTTTPEAKKAEAIVKACVANPGPLSKSFVTCIAPKGHTAALESCVITAVAHNIPLHRNNIPAAITLCVENNR